MSVCVVLFIVTRNQSVQNPVVYYTQAQPHYLCPYFRGGLGNLMFMYASLYGIAKTNEMILVLNEKDHINSVFPKLNVVRMKNTTFCEKAELVGEVRPCAYDLGTINFNKKKNIRQKAYLQSWKYFQNVEQEIREQFVFPASVQDKAQRVINNYTSIYTAKRGRVQNLQIIGVHIRRGDYLLPGKIKYGYNIVTKKYIDNAFQYFRTRYNNTCLFLVFTGTGKKDIKWREENIKGDDVLNVFANPRDIDMCALSMCNHTIITVGSFGWWSAWLANGTTVYFKDVAKQNSPLRKAFSKDMSDFFFPSWVGLE